MSQSEQLSRCLRDLAVHCENLCAENKSLRSQNDALEKQASSFAVPGVVPTSAPSPPSAENSQMRPSQTNVVDSTLTDAFRAIMHPAKSMVQSFNSTPADSSLAFVRLGGFKAEVNDQAGVVAQRKSETVKDIWSTWGTTEESDPGSPKYKQKHEGPHFTLPDLVHAIAESVTFRTFCIFVIVLNTGYLGFSADRQVKNSFRRVVGLEKQPDWIAPDISFAAWFAIELILRICAGPRDFFLGEDLRWNLFDVFLVCNSVVELLFPQMGNLSFLRIFRVFRVVRFVRVVRHIQALQSLRTMVFALMNSFVCLMWAFAMIFIIMFVFGLMFDAAVAGYFDKVNIENADTVQDAIEVHACFGSLYETLVSLFASITGGNDWMMYGQLLQEVGQGSQIYFLLFAFYIGFCMVGMLNVVTGIFVDSAVCTRTEDEVVQCWEEEQHRTSEKVKQIFREADTNCSGSLTFEELVAKFENPWVKAYFSGLDIDPTEARIIFTLMDADGDNEVSIEEFVNGTMKLKGQAKSIDVMALMFDQAMFAQKFTKLCSFLEEQMAVLRHRGEKGSEEETRVQTFDDQLHSPKLGDEDEVTLSQSKYHCRPGQDGEGRPASPELPGAYDTFSNQLLQAHDLGNPMKELQPVGAAAAKPKKQKKQKDTTSSVPSSGSTEAVQRQSGTSGNHPHASGPDAAGGAAVSTVKPLASLTQPLSLVPAAALRPEQAPSDFYL